MSRKRWTALARSLEQLAADICHASERRVHDGQELVMCLLYARVYHSFQAAIRLARAGLMDDSRAVLRTCIEHVIALRATAKDAKFIRRLIEADESGINASAQATLRDDPLGLPRNERAMEALREIVSEAARKPHKPRRIIWEHAAADEPLSTFLYQSHYREMSWHSHVSITALERYARVDADANIVAIKWRPSLVDQAETIARACDVMIWAILTKTNSLAMTQFRRRVALLRTRYSRLLTKLR